MINQTDFFFSQFIFKYFLQWKQGESSKPTDTSKKCLKDQVLLQLWESMFTLVFLALLTMNVNLLGLSYKFTLLWVYHNSYWKGCYPESGEMYQITLEKLLLILTSEFSVFSNLAHCMIQMIILLTIQLIKWIVLVSIQMLS